MPAVDSRRAALLLVLAAAVAVRGWLIATHSYLVFPDETFQYLEPAHRLAFGAGVITWEFIDGIRSWLLPGALAVVMRLVAWFSPEPTAYVGTIRALCALASLSVPFVGFRMAERRFGLVPAILAGLLAALATETVYFAPVVLTEPLATDTALLAIWLGDAAGDDRVSRRRLLLAGLLFGLACALRYQYAPVLGVAALVQHGRTPRRLAVVAAGGLAVVALALGVLDGITWGAPFQSVWLNYRFNVLHGVSGAMGTQGWYFYGAYYLVAWSVLAGPLLACAIYGGTRVPVLGAVVLATLVLHSLTPHKELRFVFLESACMPILAGIGLGCVLRRVRLLQPAAVGVPTAIAVAAIVAAWTAMATNANATPPDTWHRDRSMLQATAAARAYPAACGLAIRGIPVYRTGGYTYWHRDLPIYFEAWDDSQRIDGSAIRLKLESVIDGRSVPQFPGAALAENAGRFNVMVGPRASGLAGFAVAGCYGQDIRGDREFCMFVRAGGCD